MSPYRLFCSTDRCDPYQGTVHHRVSSRPWCILPTRYPRSPCTPCPESPGKKRRTPRVSVRLELIENKMWKITGGSNSPPAPGNTAWRRRASSWMWYQRSLPSQNRESSACSRILRRCCLALDPAQVTKLNIRDSSRKRKMMKAPIIKVNTVKIRAFNINGEAARSELIASAPFRMYEF